MDDVKPAARILVVDDEPIQLQIHEAVLSSAGYTVVAHSRAPDAIEAFREEPFDVVLTDLQMDDMDGLELMRNIRQLDLDVPVIIITATPSMDSAIRAVEYGALRYLLKPVDHGRLVEVIQRAVQLRKMAALKRMALELVGNGEKEIGDLAGLETIFASALEQLYMNYQPIVSWKDQKIFAYEALVRTREPKVPHPGVLFDAAERLQHLHQLGARIRELAPIPIGETDALLFVNLHTADLADERLYQDATAMAQSAHRIVLEITERASLEGIRDVQAKVARLRELGYRIAIDDLGAGYAGLNAFSQLEPDVVKLDMTITRGADASPTKQALIRSMANLCKDMGILLVSEGIETTEERDCLVELGCDLFQGFFFAKPGEPFPVVNWG